MDKDHGDKTQERLTEPDSARAVELIKGIESKFGPAATAQLVEPNVVLTLAGARGQTEAFLTLPTAADIENFEQLAEVLAPEGIRIQTEVFKPSFNETSLMINVESLAGYEYAIAHTELPGIQPFRAEEGWEAIDTWMHASLDGVKAAQAAGQYPADMLVEHIVVGVMKGFPDRAILSHLENLDYTDSDPNHIDDVHSNIPHAAKYPCAQPNYAYQPDVANDLEIVQHQARWGQILEQFYASPFHQELSANSEFQAARADIDGRERRFIDDDEADEA